ncbi:SHOCT domain-containing protein [Comamonas sp. JC664]|uniref:SHOCT domain-containing protein n=1 Tax=Comamonas sp. JC664 TaxID=2801917 RepID=UPI00174B2AC1|nr:SHOCT domain-containing protein [Comamonas sp. JC664]MBL0696989.1 SHOCT domain-containing protein [Comamonas sp. JC664]
MTYLFPSTPTELFVYLLVGGILAAVVWYVGGLFRDLAAAKRVLQHGEDAEATVLEVRDTAMRIDRRPVFDVHLEVRPRGRAAYRARAKEHLGRHQNAAWLSRGAQLKVKVDPNDASKVAIVGAAVTAPPSDVVTQNLPLAADPVKAMQDLQTLMDRGLVTSEELEAKKAQILARI